MTIRRVSSEQPPSDPILLTEWLTRQFTMINASINQIVDFTPIGQMPDKPVNGDAYYFGFTNTSITSKGPWMYVEGSWRKLTT